MTLRKKLGSGMESLELRAAPSTLLGAGIALDPAWHGGGHGSKLASPSFGSKEVDSGFVAKPTPGREGKADREAPIEVAAKPQALLDALFAARSAARKELSDGNGQQAYARSVDVDTADVLNFPTGDRVIEGASSTLRRTPEGISWTLKTNELEPGHVYTLWVAAFNNPDACEDGCGPDDLFRPDVAATVAYGTGRVIGPNGEATFSGHLQEGDTSGFPLDSPFVGIPGQHLGLVDASQADILFVVRDHGEVIPGRVSEQLSRYSGGCDVNNCVDAQFALHQP